MRPLWATLGFTAADFNPRTLKGCDIEDLNLKNSVLEFQSTHPQRVRPHKMLYLLPLYHISIHAPSKGATSLARFSCHFWCYFNPRTLKGCDLKAHYRLAGKNIFQSTHPQRVRLGLLGLRSSAHANFNPRTLKGCDISSGQLLL